MQKASLAEKFGLIHEHWRPKVVAQLNGQEVKLAKKEFEVKQEMVPRGQGRRGEIRDGAGRSPLD